MRRAIQLDGPGWTVEGFIGLDAALGAAARPQASDRPGAVPASVPGSILHDVWRAGLVADPYVGLGSLAAEWVPERAWLYRRRVDAPALAPSERAWLAFDGLDHAGEAFWDGAPIGRHEGMFVPFELDLAGHLHGQRAGPHELAVVIEPAPENEPQVGRTSRVGIHKSRMGYGWDFCPRMVHQGLWQSVRLVIAGDVRILDVWGRPSMSGDLRAATVEVRVTLDASVARAIRLDVELVGETHGRATATIDVKAGRSEAVVRLDVPEPALWWPNGAGVPVVHRLVVRALEEDGAILDEMSVPLGFRTVERIPNEGASADARPWTWVVNGRRLYVRGWNWVPMDAQYGVPRPARLDHLLRLARDAHVNMLRVWGGGLIETRPFYEACDAHGLMVWQELAQSSSGTESSPSDDPAFVELMAREAAAIVPLRRNHPSLVAWCGGNELQGPDGPLDDTTPVLGAIRDVVAVLDPDRAWLPTSPSGPRFHNSLEGIESDPDGLHDVHGPWEHQGLRGQHELYDRGTSLFNSEFGVEGMTNRRTHEALMSPADRWPPTRDNRTYRHLGDWWINEPLVQASFGGRLGDLETLRRASQHLQADGLRYAVEANRRRAFRNSGSIPWQLNESYPNAWCTSAVDHRGDPKPAYFAVRRAFAPVVVAASFDRGAWGGADGFEAAVWAWSDVDPIRGAAVAARVVDAGGQRHAEASLSAELVADQPVRLGTFAPAAPLPELFMLDLVLTGAEGGTLATNRYVLIGRADLGPLLDLQPAALRIAVAAADDHWEVRLELDDGPAALGVRIEDDRPIEAAGWAEVEDGAFDLLPGEARSVGVRWAGDDPASARRLRVSGWNVAGSVVAAP
jgi:beta-mannosidase